MLRQVNGTVKRAQTTTTVCKLQLLLPSDQRTSVSAPAGSNASGQVQGQVKVTVQYLRGQLQIMVHHARNLSLINNGQEPSPYVKLYLLPDPNKKTKRKTKVVKKSCHPTFMEPVSCNMPYLCLHDYLFMHSICFWERVQENILKTEGVWGKNPVWFEGPVFLM